MKTILDNIERMLAGIFKLPGALIPAQNKPALEPIEIRRAIIRDISDQVQSKGGGVYFFPYRGVLIELLAQNDAEKQLLQATFDETDIASEVGKKLAERGCRPDEMAVSLSVIERPRDAASVPYRIQYQFEPSTPVAAARPPARLLVLQGEAETPELTIDRDFIYIGRMKEVRNNSGGIERRNELAFNASETSVSRKHAWIRYDPAEGKFRAYNDASSSLGTSVLRDGKPMPCDSTRGVQLRSGDELVLGQVRIRFEITGS